MDFMTIVLMVEQLAPRVVRASGEHGSVPKAFCRQFFTWTLCWLAVSFFLVLNPCRG